MPRAIEVDQGGPQFSYGGYGFEIVEGWPVDWVYNDDDYFIGHVDDDYWLYGFHHPAVRLALMLVG